jgi:small-conductance mechanosensitive channel
MTVDMLSDLDKVERVTLDVARSVLRDVHGAVSSAEPTVRFLSITETGVRLSVGLRVRHFVDQILVRHEFLKRLRARYGEEGILHPVITFPAPASTTGTTSPAGTAGAAGTARA